LPIKRILEVLRIHCNGLYEMNTCSYGSCIKVVTFMRVPEFQFQQLNVMPQINETLQSFNKRKQEQYLQSDIFIQFALCEGSSYSALDSLLTRQILVSTNTGFAYELNKDSFVEIDWKKCYGDTIDYEFLCSKIRYAWNNKEELSQKGREWYMKNCRFANWEVQMKNTVKEFYHYNYSHK